MALEWVIYKGQVGAVRYGRARDGDGYVDLSQFDSVTFIAHSSLTSNPVIDAAVTIDPDQVTNKGRFSYTFDNTTSNVPVRKYDYCGIKCLDGTTPTYFPLDRRSERTYFRLVVQDPVG